MSVVKAQHRGVFYRCPGPQADPYVVEGVRVDQGQTVGLIEMLKTYSPVKAVAVGTVARFLLDDGDHVEEGQAVLELDDSE